jgi:hypothetical protein
MTKTRTPRPWGEIDIRRITEHTRAGKGTVGIENTGNADINMVLPLESVCEGLSDTLPFVVASAGPNWIHVSPAISDVRHLIHNRKRQKRTNLRVEGVPPDHHTPLQ